MTWYYNIRGDNQYMDVYDHTGQLVHTCENVEDGFRLPDDVKQVMEDKWRQEVTLGESPVLNEYAGHLLIDLVMQNIEAGTPA